MTLQIDGIVGLDITAREIREQLEAAGGEDIEMVINSPGGSVTEGIAVFNAIRDYRRSGAGVTARVVGLAGSMATYIPLAAETVTVEDNAVWMIHEPSMIALGRKSDMERAASILEGVSRTIARAYVDKTGKEMDEIRQLMADETYLFGEEITEAGFADSVEPAGEGPDNQEEAVALAQAAVYETEKRLVEAHEDIGQIAAMIGAHEKQESTPVVDGIQPAAKAETHKEGVMDLNTLKNEHPAVFAEAVQAGQKQGVEAERARVAELRSYIEADPENSRVREVVESAIAEGKSVSEINAKLQVAIRDGGKLDGENPPAVGTAGDEMEGLDADDREAIKLMGISASEYKELNKEVI